MENKLNVLVNEPVNEPQVVIEKTRKCRICGKILPLSKFERFGNHGYHSACKACEGKDFGLDERFKSFESRELILELRARGYRGKLQKVTIDEVVI